MIAIEVYEDNAGLLHITDRSIVACIPIPDKELISHIMLWEQWIDHIDPANIYSYAKLNAQTEKSPYGYDLFATFSDGILTIIPDKMGTAAKLAIGVPLD